jgi:hypothetical protein
MVEIPGCEMDTLMKRKPVVHRLENLREVVGSLSTPANSLNPVYIYEDSATRNWAQALHERLERMAGTEVRATWWKLADLGHPGVLAGAVSKTIRAGLVVIAVRGGEGLPLPFYVWINTWLPHRVAGTGALVALVAEVPQPGAHSGRVLGHLKAVAREGGMKFILGEMPTCLLKEQRVVWAAESLHFMARVLRDRIRNRVAACAGGRRRTAARGGVWLGPARGGLGRKGEI